MRLDAGRGPQAPHSDLAFFGDVRSGERAAMLAGEIEVDGERFVQHQPVIVDRGDEAVRIDLQEFRRLGVQHPGRHGAIVLDYRHLPERDAEFPRPARCCATRGTGRRHRS
jgi:hypothetical protein